VPITLLYHDVVRPGREEDSGFSGGGPARYKLTEAEFREHLAAVAAVVSAPPANEVEVLADPSAPRWLIAFDDGGASAAPTADWLEERGWRGHFFVTTDYLDTPTFLSRAQVRDLHRRGHVIGSHSCSHPSRMATCSREQILEEWRRSREVLAEVLGVPVVTASVPGGYYSRVVGQAAAAAGLKLLFNSEPTTRPRSIDGCVVLGRYSIYRGMTAAQAAALVAPGSAARLGQTIAWNAKKIAKTLGGAGYVRLRRRLLNRSAART
jgi:peptidoglycan/xylan/chitin deacetylase (PgdA/CDA1 family)